MALTGLQINKLLPGTNCKECGSSTCLAFAMKMASKKAEIAQCPYASDEAKKTLGAAAEPPVKTVALGPQGALKLGGETVLYRHEKTFVSPTAVAVAVDASRDPQALDQELARIASYRLERVGQVFQVDMVAVVQGKATADAFAAAAKKAFDLTRRPLVLKGNDAASLLKAAQAVQGARCVLSAADGSSAAELMKGARETGHALAVTGSDLDAVAALAGRMREGGFQDLVLQFPETGLKGAFLANTVARRAALLDGLKNLGYPSLRFLSGPLMDTGLGAAVEIAKYGGIVVLPCFDPALLSPLLTLRLNLYTDPQKPVQVEPKVYAVGEPMRSSPVFVTTNFSLTYFIVTGEIENAGLSAHLVVPECEGMSVLTAWAAGKFNGTRIARFIKETGFENEVDTRRIIIPGYVSTISGELEESLPGWKVLVGPQEASDIESFARTRLQN